MKSKIYLLLLLLSCWPPCVSAYDVYIHVTGVLYGNTCTLSTTSKSMNLHLGNISLRQFSAVGATGQIKTPFTIRLEECGPNFKGAKVTFSGTADDGDSRYLKTDDDGASGVAVMLSDSSNKVIPLNTATAAYGLTGANSVDMLFYAQLVATQLPVIAGGVSARATYTVEYL